MSATIKVRSKASFTFNDMTNPDSPVPFEPGAEVEAVETAWVKTQVNAGVFERVEDEADPKAKTPAKKTAVAA